MCFELCRDSSLARDDFFPSECHSRRCSSSFLFRWTSCIEGTVLSRGGPLWYFLGGIIMYTSAFHPPSLSASLESFLPSYELFLARSDSTAVPAVVPLE